MSSIVNPPAVLLQPLTDLVNENISELSWREEYVAPLPALLPEMLIVHAYNVWSASFLEALLSAMSGVLWVSEKSLWLA